MAEFKKVLISLPDELLKEIDTIVAVENINRSEFVRRAMLLYIREKKRIKLRDLMKKGYKEMAEINLELAQSCCNADTEQQLNYEVHLGERET